MPIPRGISVQPILVPKAHVDPTKWAVVACDQYTSELKYWDDVDKIVGDAPSTLRIFLPEAFLSEQAERIPRINETMKRYLEEDIFQEVHGIILVKRTVGAAVRYGIMASLDLEEYSFEAGTTSLVRATEQTIAANLPPRIAIREDAPLELPHIMVLIDDPLRRTIAPIAERLQAEKVRPLYDFDLMKDSGHLTGWLLDEAAQAELFAAMGRLFEKEEFMRKYDVPADTPLFVYAMGDGNHSLATAKVIWERVKAEHRRAHPDSTDLPDDPRRYSLVEIENIHDPGIEFEPIHRVLFRCDAAHPLPAFLRAGLEGWEERDAETLAALTEEVFTETPDRLRFGLVRPGPRFTSVSVAKTAAISYAALQPLLDRYVTEGKAHGIDYIHGARSTTDVTCENPDNVGIIMPPLPKSGIIKAVIEGGVLPRKSFSMGEAESKRFYFDCRRIK
eukprot:gnl/Chilomastix_cuspidata/478.p3 GENE.gnl/Chilomastix_cuspidata/478~~gnl/Chilomastix_cuspidata/478.p3  ORF type:complete len:447 (-),score=257.67 gnl/Chilomastix_cuspidata/478:960-2300(-)